jgi:hypothetical protein
LTVAGTDASTVAKLKGETMSDDAQAAAIAELEDPVTDGV